MVRRFTRNVLRNMKEAGIAKVSVNRRVGYEKQCFRAWLSLSTSAGLLSTIAIMYIRLHELFLTHSRIIFNNTRGTEDYRNSCIPWFCYCETIVSNQFHVLLTNFTFCLTNFMFC